MENRKGATACHYRVLGVPESADAAAIKEAFRKLVLSNHPDKSVDSDADYLTVIQKAYHILRDETKRKQYDEELRLERQRIQSRFESAIVLEKSDCEIEKGDDGVYSLVYPCRCGIYLDTSPLEDDEYSADEQNAPGEEEDEGLLACPGCSLVYDTRKLNE